MHNARWQYLFNIDWTIETENYTRTNKTLN